MAPAKKKTEKMPLGVFLQDENYGSWADEMEDMPLPSGDRSYGGGERRAYSSNFGMSSGFNNDRNVNYAVREELPLPTEPPFTAHIGNMAFDTTEGEVGEFFKDCDVAKVRIVEDKMDRKPKGFGYVEFATLDGLKKALSYAGSSLAGRTIRVSVADPPKDRGDIREIGDWTRKGPLPDLPGQRRVSERPSFQSRGMDNVSDAGSERGGRKPFDQGDGRVRDLGNWERKGPLSPAATAASPNLSLREGGRQQSKDGPAFRKSSPAWGEGTGRSQDGSRPPRREYQDRPAREFQDRPAPAERAPGASELDNKWRSNMRPDQAAKSPTPSRDPSNPPSPAPAPVPATRPKLNLKKRTVSEADPSASPVEPASGVESKASPFGAARPVDTSAKEKEIEEKREVAIKEKREAEEKAKADKAEQVKERREAKEKALVEKASKDGDSKTDKAGEAKQGKKIEIVRRPSGPANGTGDDGEAKDKATGEAKSGKSTEGTRTLPSRHVEDVCKTLPKQPEPQASEGQDSESSQAGKSPSGEVDENGWSTVTGKQRNPRRGNQQPRSAAS